MMRFPALIITTALALVAAPGDDDYRALVRRSLTGLESESGRVDRYLFKVRNERKELDSAGKVLSQTSYVWERIEIDGFTFGRTLERNGKALTDEERRQEEAGIQKRLAELKAPATKPGEKANPRKGPAQEDWFKEFPEALEYRLVAEETVNGRLTVHLAATPRPGYQAKNMRARVFEKMKGDLWIDKATGELAKVDAEMFDTVSVGFGVLGKIEKGTRFMMQRRPVSLTAASADWLTESRSIRFGARILLVKTMRNESNSFFSEFRPRPSTSARPMTAASSAGR